MNKKRSTYIRTIQQDTAHFYEFLSRINYLYELNKLKWKFDIKF